MTDFKKILDHPEKQLIISKLCSGDSPKSIAIYLKNKYSKPDENHLRIGISLLEEFVNKYGAKYGFIKTIAKEDISSKLDKEIAQSLLNNQEWRDRVASVTDEEINLRQKLGKILTILEVRAEQLFDKIQENPGDVKKDYVFDKIMNTLLLAIDRIDKIQNNRPDIKIEHTYTVQMVEQHTAAFQDAIRKVLQRMSPEFAIMFMEYLNEEMTSMRPTLSDNSAAANKKAMVIESSITDKLLSDAIEIEAEDNE